MAMRPPASPGPGAHLRWAGEVTRHRNGTRPGPGLLRDASAIYRDAAARGTRLSQRALARQLRSQGHSVILISHRMPDVFAVADRIVVLRRGHKVADKPIAESTPEEVTGLITGAIRLA